MKRLRPLLLLVLLWMPTAVQAQTAVATQAIHVVIVKVRSYPEVEEIRKRLQEIPGVHGISLRSETSDLITLGIEYSDLVETLTQACQKAFENSYSVTQKILPSGVMEINLVRR